MAVYRDTNGLPLTTKLTNLFLTEVTKDCVLSLTNSIHGFVLIELSDFKIGVMKKNVVAQFQKRYCAYCQPV